MRTRDNTILLLRLLSFYIGFSLVIVLPHYMYQLLTIRGSLSVIINIYAHIIYPLTLAYGIWFLAPWFSQKISKFHTMQINVDIVTRSGLIIIYVISFFEKTLIFISGLLTWFFASSHYIGSSRKSFFVYFLHNEKIIFSIISLIIIIIFFLNYKKTYSLLIAKL